MNVELIKEVMEKEVTKLGYDFVSLIFAFRNGEHVLTLTIDRVDPISMNDILKVNEVLNPILDELIKDDNESFNFEITSLGAEKPLKVEQLSSYISRYVEVRLINPVEGENIYEGDIKEVTDSELVITIRIKTRKKDIRIEKSNISKIRLAIKF